MAEEAAPKGPSVITSTVGSDEKTVLAVRNEIPIGPSGAPIERIPWGARVEAWVNAGTVIKRLGPQERCLRPVILPLKGGKEGKFACSLPCVSVGTDGEKYCPEHDREMFRPIQDHPPKNQRVFNSASIHLSDAEKQVTYEKDGKRYVAELSDGRDIAALRRGESTENIVPAQPTAVKRVRAPKGNTAPKRLSAPKGDSLRFTVNVSDLVQEDADQIVYRLIAAAIAGLDCLPAKSVADVKRVIAIQDKLKQFSLEEGK